MQTAVESVPRVRVSDAIRRVVGERPRTGKAVTDIVSNLLPDVDRKTISTIIGQRVSAGEFVRDGKIVRLRG